MEEQRTPPPAAPEAAFRTPERRSRFLYDAQGNLNSGRILIGIGATGAVIVLGTYIALVASGVGNPAILGIGVVVILLGIKLPLLWILWRLMGRHLEKPGRPRWTAEEHQEILARLEEAARSTAGRGDAAGLAHISREAWGIVDLSPDAGKADAIAAALRIDELAAAAREPRLRP
jgi:hypothetical protein